MQDRGADTRADAHRGANGAAEGVASPAAPDDADDRLLDLLERWEERYRRDEDAAPESLGVADPALLEALRERIERQKRLYGFLKLSPSGAFAGAADRAAPPPEGHSEAPALDESRAEPAPEPTTIGRYRVLRALGEGGFGRVYLAYDVDLRRDVAVKVPLPGDASRFLDVEAYLREARIVARLSHPNIVPVYDVGRTDDGRYYIVSKYMEGGDLRSRLGLGRPAFAESAGLVAVLCEALHYTHTQDLFHRDIKPANILLDAAGSPSLADFGLALRDEDVGRGAGYLGTAAYMSPEQARGEGHRIDGRSDIFSIGVVLYELLTGRRPFRGRTSPEIMEQVIGVEPRPPRQIDDAIPLEVERICLRALAKRASERYTTARDMADDLRHFLDTVSWASPTIEMATVTPSVRDTAPRTATGTSDSGTHPIRIVPKGLGSFDEHDADFFLELLPGPRDRDGLPDGLRFWKTRIEAVDPDRTFRVGLIYGPSGCGKSSMVKAGLLPRLAAQICAVYVEAAGAETEARLLRGLRRHFPALPAACGLAEGLKALRHGHGLPAGSKVLLVLDQFEQWLFARPDAAGDGLVAALRQCDGERIQALCLVRDDFWMASTRLMKDLEIDLIPGRNLAAVDLFEPRHARRVLAAYGRAYEVLPQGAADLSRDQDAFLDQAVAGLAQDGLVVPVRLALFAEMVKGRPWTPATLREVGGMDGVGVKFLEDTFGSARSHPHHRYHLRAAQSVLKALLPEANADIKGRMRPVEELREISGYADRPADFADLVRLLDGELRLITPVDPEGSVEDDRPIPSARGQFFQLTHDYLVHSLRDWLTRKQRETRRGRAELLLAERTALWSSRPEDRYLPSIREWSSIRLLTDRNGWGEAQRRMMGRAGRVIGLRAAVAAALSGVAVAAGLVVWQRVDESNKITHANGLVQRLFGVDTPRVPEIIPEILEYRPWTEPQLRRIVADPRAGPKEDLHARLALLPGDPRQAPYVFRRAIEASPVDLPVLRMALKPYAAGLIPALWDLLESAVPGDARVLTSAGILASFDPDGARWKTLGGKVAHEMVGVNPHSLDAWVEVFRPVGGRLKDPLARIARGDARKEGERSVAIDFLAVYAREDAAPLADLVVEASPRDFEKLFPVAARHADRVVPAWKARLGKAPGPEGPRGERDREVERRALAAVALWRMGEHDAIWPHLRHGPDPRLRGLIVNWLRPLGAHPMMLAAELERLDAIARAAPTPRPTTEADVLFDPVTSERRAIILALGNYDPGAIPPQQREPLIARLLDRYQADPDAGVHGAAGWTLRRWGSGRRVAEEDAALRGVDRGERRWFVNPQGQTFVVVGGELDFLMGSPPDEPGNRPHEVRHRRLIHRRFALSTTEVTIAQYRRFLEEHPRARRADDDGHSPDPDGPRNWINWYEAAEYCNWLSRREGLTEIYEPNEAGRFADGMRMKAGASRLNGYRLPTEAEWEYMCRAGTTTSRPYGDSRHILGNHAWSIANSGDRAHSCGSLMPNDLGMSDMLGNLYEWCQGAAITFEPDASGRLVDRLDEPEVIRDGKQRVIRGGSFTDREADCRSANRDRDVPESNYMTYGFRLARTIP